MRDKALLRRLFQQAASLYDLTILSKVQESVTCAGNRSVTAIVNFRYIEHRGI